MPDTLMLLLIALGTSADIFAVSVGIRASGIRFPFLSALAAAVSGAAVLWGACMLSGAARDILSSQAAVTVSRLILAFMGIRELIADRKEASAAKPPAILRSKRCEYISDCSLADSDRSRSISIPEAVILSLALSADSAVSGLSAGLCGLPAGMVFLLTAVLMLILIGTGCAAGKKIAASASSVTFDAACISGCILILLAVLIG